MEEKPQCIYIKKTYKIFVFCICSIMFYHGIWYIFIFNKIIFIWRIKDTSTRRKFFTDWTNPVCINLAITPISLQFYLQYTKNFNKPSFLLYTIYSFTEMEENQSLSRGCFIIFEGVPGYILTFAPPPSSKI